MSGKLDKKVRRAVSKKVHRDYSDLVNTLAKEGLLKRCSYALQIVFKKKPKVKVRIQAVPN